MINDQTLIDNIVQIINPNALKEFEDYKKWLIEGGDEEQALYYAKHKTQGYVLDNERKKARECIKTIIDAISEKIDEDLDTYLELSNILITEVSEQNLKDILRTKSRRYFKGMIV